jgi:methylated-DNA-protein-cysteine methyltransferase-like protein
MSAGRGRNQRVWDVVRAIPRGRVASGARQVGYALAALAAGSTVPWHRVVNVRGTVSLRSVTGREDQQYDRLAAEGVAYDAAGRIDLAVYEWNYGIE